MTGTVALRYLFERADFSLDVDVQIPMHGITGIFGESGSGKTTLLRCLAGLEQPTTGRLAINGDLLQDTAQGLSRAIHRRKIAYVFQEPRLFSHLNVLGNLDYAHQRNSEQEDAIEFDQVVNLLGLANLLHRRPAELSGGEAQRVAIARALLRAPSLVLMDEPLAALDRLRKDEILPFLDRLHTELSLPILYVSHNIDEVCRLCDHIIVMDQGRVVADGEIQSVLVSTDLPVLAGEEAGSAIVGTIVEYDPDYELSRLKFSGGTLLLPGRFGDAGTVLRLRIRANDVSLCRSRSADSTVLNIIAVTIDRIQVGEGPFALVRLQAGNDLLTARLTRRSCDDLQIRPGEQLFAQIKSVAVRNAVSDD